MSRYARQTTLPEIGEAGQQRLEQARVTVIGAGGLGVPVLQYLTGAGIGQITLVDPDVVEVSNLHRQPIYGEQWLGETKVVAAKSILQELNPNVTLLAHATTLDASNIAMLASDVDLVLDCADSFAATYIASDYCYENKVPLISASALGTKGYVGGFCGSAPSMRAVFPDLPTNLATCATAGVFGPVVGTLGTLQAQMAMSVLLQMQPSPLGKLISFDGQNLSFSSFRFDNAPEPEEHTYRFIAASQIEPNDYVVELRSAEEVSEPITKDADRLQADDLYDKRAMPISESERTVFVCRSGVRAWRAAKNLEKWWNGPIALVAAGTHTGEPS